MLRERDGAEDGEDGEDVNGGGGWEGGVIQA